MMATEKTEKHAELVERLTCQYGIEPVTAERVVEEILVSFGDSIEEWVRSQHIRLQRQGLKNEAIYREIARELPQRRFVSPVLSERQIRRMIYG